MLHEDMQRQLTVQQFSTATFVASEVNDALNERINALAEAAKALAPSMRNPIALRKALAQQTVLELLFSGGVVAIGSDGIGIGDLPLPAKRIGVNYKGDDWIDLTLKDGKPRIGRPVLGKVLSVPVFVMASPILDPQGKLLGILAGVVNLGKPTFLDNITHGHYGKTGGYTGATHLLGGGWPS